MKILFATAEAAPYYRTGGLGDVARALPDRLVAAGHDVRIITPSYGPLDEVPTDALPAEEMLVPWPARSVRVRFLHHENPDGAHAVLVHQPAFFTRGSPYTASFTDPIATGVRFALFCRAIVAYARSWRADIVHTNDWPTGLVPVYGLLDGLDAPTVFTIHNLAYQGSFPPALLYRCGIPRNLMRTENGIEFFGSASFMKAALALSDRLVTVSPTYAAEIRTLEYGAGFDGLLRFRRRVLHGILNGIDTSVWQPATDRAIAATYSVVNVEPRQQNRAALLEETGLEDGGPIFGMVSRLAHQKGIDLLIDALPRLVDAGARVAVIGSGDPASEQALLRASSGWPGRVSVFIGFDDARARRLYAGADFFLMPSRYEPCGLGQMIAQRYGTPPVVRATGGLVDTVEDGKTGFTFADATPEALADAVERAMRSWQARGWVTLQRRCMRLDWSWARSAERYEQVYRLAIGALPG